MSGLLPNDVIIAVDNKKIRGIPDLQEMVGTARVGEELLLTVRRGKNKYEIPVVLQSEN